jgi:DNA-binding NarL/FixJ family response regulator
MADAVRILVVEDNETFREALELLLALEPGLELVAAVGDGESALACLDEAAPDVVLVDYRLPDLDGVETTAAVRQRRPGTVVVALTAVAEESEVAALLAAGASACLSKTDDLRAIVSAIRAAVAGAGR